MHVLAIFIFSENGYSDIFIILLKIAGTHQLLCSTQVKKKKKKRGVFFLKLGTSAKPSKGI